MDRERKLGWNQWKRTEKIVRDRKKFEIEGVRDRERVHCRWTCAYWKNMKKEILLTRCRNRSTKLKITTEKNRYILNLQNIKFT